jgi:hypothetical protein
MQNRQEEYLALFSKTGDINVSVKFEDFEGIVADQKMQPSEITKLINHRTGKFLTRLRFDDWPFDIYQLQIDLVEKNWLSWPER